MTNEDNTWNILRKSRVSETPDEDPRDEE